LGLAKNCIDLVLLVLNTTFNKISYIVEVNLIGGRN